jgi:hypothetical protein
MTDIDLIRDLRPQVQLPGPVELAGARGRLTAVIAAERADGTVPASAPGLAAARANRSRARRARAAWLPRRLVFAAGLALAVAAIAAGATLVSLPGPSSVGPPTAEAAAALSFTRHGGYIDVIVRNPVADPKFYQEDFQAHGLHIRLFLLPVSPSLVGTVVFIDTLGPGGDSITTITAKGRCWTGGGGNRCPVGLRVPIGYRGQAAFTFGRAARPGELYESTAPADAPGEVMHGLKFRGKTVPAVLAMLRRRHVTARLRDFYTAQILNASDLRGTWYVYNADPWAPQQVLLYIGTNPINPMGGS